MCTPFYGFYFVAQTSVSIKIRKWKFPIGHGKHLHPSLTKTKQNTFSNLTEYLLEFAAKVDAVWNDKTSTCVCLLPWEGCEGGFCHKVWNHLDICGSLCLDLFKSSILRQRTERLFQIKG